VPAKITPSEKVFAVIKSIPQFNASWKVELLNEAQWKEFKRKSNSRSDAASTALELHTTFLRQSFVQSATQAMLDHVLWHEAGHINCSCGSEEAAELYAHQHH
jgi:hypothetical protein